MFTNMALYTICKKIKSFSYHITIFDNSTISRFELDLDLHQCLNEKISIIDNTKQ